MKKKSPKKRSSKKGRKFLSTLLKITFFTTIWGFILGIIALLWFVRDIPDLGNMDTFTRQPGIVIKDRDGDVLATYGHLFGKPVNIKELPPYLIQAILVVEDKRFYDHFGLDLKGIARAFWVNRQAGRIVQGGSSITQQLAKNILISTGQIKFNDQSYKRKIQEVFLVFQLERKFTKDEILTLYLNRVYLGSGTYGIDAASRKYFHKPASQLTIFESAVIAGLLKSPSTLSPHCQSQQYIERTQTILRLMEEAGYIKDARHYLEEGKKSEIKPPQSGVRYFTDYIRDSLELYINQLEDLEVTTTLDLKMQNAAEHAVEKVMEKESAPMKASQAAFIAMTPTGEIKAMVGGLKHSASQWNRTTALRQAGSVIKPFVYLAAFEYLGKTMNDTISDELFVRGSWKPGNLKWQSRGQISLLTAITYSVNSPTIRLADMVGVKNVKKMLTDIGIHTYMPDDLTIALGSGVITLLDITSAYAAFANHGHLTNPYGILMIKNKSGKVLYKHKDYPTPRIMTKKSCQEMLTGLQNIVHNGTGRRLNLGDSSVYGKSGSNSNPVTRGTRDVWFCGFRTTGTVKGFENIVFGAWAGNDKNEDMHKDSYGSRIPAMICREFLVGGSK